MKSVEKRRTSSQNIIAEPRVGGFKVGSCPLVDSNVTNYDIPENLHEEEPGYSEFSHTFRFDNDGPMRDIVCPK